MARNVTDCENQPAIGELKGVIPITANCRFVTRCNVFCIQAYTRNCREPFWQLCRLQD
jgi:hypothetical protein